MDTAAEGWIRAHVDPAGTIETTHVRPWATVMRVPTRLGTVWFKACAPVQAFEPRLTASLFARWPDRVPRVLAHDEDRAWLLLADAGTRIDDLGNPPEAWLAVLPIYAELQLGEARHAADHLAHGVPDLRLATLPARYEDLVARHLPLEPGEIARLRDFAPAFERLCAELAGYDLPQTIQHDDLHLTNVYEQDGQLRVLDWGDSSIGHPFASLVTTFRFHEEVNRLPPTSPWFGRLRDAYLEPWGRDRAGAFELGVRVGTFAHAIASIRLRDRLATHDRAQYDTDFTVVLRRAVARTIR